MSVGLIRIWLAALRCLCAAADSLHAAGAGVGVRAVALTLLGASAWRGGHPTGLSIRSGLVHGWR